MMIPGSRRRSEAEIWAFLDVWYMLSQCYDQLGDKTNALNAAKQAVTLAPDRPRFVEQLVNQLRSTGQTSEAGEWDLRLQPLRKYREEIDQPSAGSVDRSP